MTGHFTVTFRFKKFSGVQIQPQTPLKVSFVVIIYYYYYIFYFWSFFLTWLKTSELGGPSAVLSPPLLLQVLLFDC